MNDGTVLPEGSILAADLLPALIIAGLLGAVGQVLRAAIGLKKASESAKDNNVDFKDQFVTSRLVISLIIGFGAGVIAILVKDLENLREVSIITSEIALAIIAAGYAGTDFVEGALGFYKPKLPAE